MKIGKTPDNMRSQEVNATKQEKTTESSQQIDHPKATDLPAESGLQIDKSVLEENVNKLEGNLPSVLQRVRKTVRDENSLNILSGKGKDSLGTIISVIKNASETTE